MMRNRSAQWLAALQGGLTIGLTAINSEGLPTWLAVLDGAYLWAPLADAGAEAAWWVRDGDGRLISLFAGEDYTLQQEGRPAPTEFIETRAGLFLAGRMGAL